jgi:hypothetical protein
VVWWGREDGEGGRSERGTAEAATWVDERVLPPSPSVPPPTHLRSLPVPPRAPPLQDPLRPQDVLTTLSNIAAGRYRALPGWVSPLCTDLLRRTLVKDPDLRITLPDILSHPWLAVAVEAEAAAPAAPAAAGAAPITSGGYSSGSGEVEMESDELQGTVAAAAWQQQQMVQLQEQAQQADLLALLSGSSSGSSLHSAPAAVEADPPAPAHGCAGSSGMAAPAALLAGFSFHHHPAASSAAAVGSKATPPTPRIIQLTATVPGAPQPPALLAAAARGSKLAHAAPVTPIVSRSAASGSSSHAVYGAAPLGLGAAVAAASVVKPSQVPTVALPHQPAKRQRPSPGSLQLGVWRFCVPPHLLCGVSGSEGSEERRLAA